MMNLLDIKDPQFLKSMNNKELTELAEEIRSFIIEKVSKNGGHLSSNLGIVDLTIALHKVFNSPKDKFIFDVGHQSYTHKILTGRAKDFDKLRQLNGLSGYQKREESEHDHWESGHSSTAIAALAGFEYAKIINKTNERNIAIVGDGSLNSGLSFEALNFLGHANKNAPIIILNDNDMSISKNVGRLAKLLNTMRTTKIYTYATKTTRRLPKLFISLKVRFSNMVRGFANNMTIFDQFGFSYYGPIDGHDMKTLVKSLNIVKNRNVPCVLHVVTKKGKGFLPAENDQIGTWHGVGPFDISTGKFKKNNAENIISWSNIISDYLENYAKNDPDFRVIVPAMVFGSALTEFQRKYPKQIIDVGICESFAVCFSAALALNHTKVFIPIYSSFLQRAYDQVSHDLARQDIKVVIGIDRAGLVGADGETHQGIYDIAFLRHIPNIEIVQPSTSLEAWQLLDYAFNVSKHSVAIRYSRGSAKKYDGEKYEPITSPSWQTQDNSGKVNLICYGDNYLRMNKYIKEKGLPINVINARFIKPLDTVMVKKLLEMDIKTYVLEDVTVSGGLGSSIFEYAQAENISTNGLHIIGLPDQFIEQGKVEELYKKFKMDSLSVVKKILEE